MKKVIILVLVMALVLPSCISLGEGGEKFLKLSKGSKGEAVVELQNSLNELGYSVGTADGDFGNKTEKALKQFQKENDIDDTGKLDERTYNMLFSDGAKRANVNNTSTTASNQQTKNLNWDWSGTFGDAFFDYSKLAIDVFSDSLFIDIDGNIKGYIYLVDDSMPDVQFYKKDTLISGSKVGEYIVGQNAEGYCNLYGKYQFDRESWHKNSDRGPSYKVDDSWHDLELAAAGLNHAIGLRKDGTWVTTGKNDYGQCDVTEWQDIVRIGIGKNHTVGLKANGTVVAVGDNASMQCQVQDWESICEICVYNNTTVGLKTDGTVVATGDNSANQCKVDNWSNIVALDCGYFRDFEEGESGGEWAEYYLPIGVTVEGRIITPNDKYTFALNNMIPESYRPGDIKHIDSSCTVEYYHTKDDVKYYKVDRGYVMFINADKSFNMYGYCADGKSPVEITMKALKQTTTGYNKSTTPNSTGKTTIYSESSCESIAIDYLKKYLKNPASLQIHGVTSSKSDDSYTFLFDYSAMNSFGGYTRSSYICVVDSITGKVTAAYSN